MKIKYGCIPLLFILMFILSIDIKAQVIKNSDLDSAINAIENFLNNKKQNSIFTYISVNEWNPSYHNGYSPKCKKYFLNLYPYETYRVKDILDAKNFITISIKPDNKIMIIVLNLDNTYYAFYSELKIEKGKYKILEIPYGLHEGD